MAFGEKVMLRLMDPALLFRNIDDLGFSEAEKEQYQAYIARSTGLLLITGPANSGKTTTLYSTLHELSQHGINITTVEDPIESLSEQFNQISVQPQAGLTFKTAMRHLVRQSPDVIMVGEMRDKDSAEHTMQAALTGHLVFSTLHTHDASSALIRLVNMGVEQFLVESTVIAVIAQRLIRKVCSHCARPYQPTEREMEALRLSREEVENLALQKGAGCPACRGTGYFGQTAIFEIMEINDRLRELIHQNAEAHALKQAAIQQGMATLQAKVMEKMKAGVTTSEEVLRVTGRLRDRKPRKFKSKIILTTD